MGFWAEVAVDGGLELEEGLDDVFEAGWRVGGFSALVVEVGGGKS